MFTSGTDLKRAWLSWEEMSFSGETPEMDLPSGVDLSDLGRRIAVIFRDYFEENDLNEADVDELERCEETLIRVVPSLRGDDRPYFAMALSIAQWMLEIQAGTDGQATTGGSDSAPSEKYSWRKPGIWRLAYGVPWVMVALLLVVAMVVAPATWFGFGTPGSVLTTALVLIAALLPAAGFVLARGRVGLFLIAALGFLMAFVLFLAAIGIDPPGTVFLLLQIAVLGAFLASVIAIVVLLIASHETRPPSGDGWFSGDGGWGDDG
jgi:hypothetical protein